MLQFTGQTRIPSFAFLVLFLLLCVCLLFWNPEQEAPSNRAGDIHKQTSFDGLQSAKSRPAVATSFNAAANHKALAPTVPKQCLSHLTSWYDRGEHRVIPPKGNVNYVCCNSTKGFLHILVHPTWAPLGAANFEQMVDFKFFDSGVPMMRALKGFIIQFGLNGNTTVQRAYEEQYLGRRFGGLKDDPNWLPEGPPGRKDPKTGVHRFQKGYLAYAGGGKNSRGTQLIVALQNNAFLAGGSPWEVPWGQLITQESFITLDKFTTEYGEKVSQGKIRRQGKAYIDAEFPHLDYITWCSVVNRNLTYHWYKY
jgi:peptidyl-prolyl cis-trans isomerase A (cyclophilin A)